MSGDGRKQERGNNRNPRKTKQKKQQHLCTAEEELEAKCGFDVFSEGESARLGWLLTFASVQRGCIGIPGQNADFFNNSSPSEVSASPGVYLVDLRGAEFHVGHLIFNSQASSRKSYARTAVTFMANQW